MGVARHGKIGRGQKVIVMIYMYAWQLKKVAVAVMVILLYVDEGSGADKGIGLDKM